MKGYNRGSQQQYTTSFLYVKQEDFRQCYFLICINNNNNNKNKEIIIDRIRVVHFDCVKSLFLLFANIWC